MLDVAVVGVGAPPEERAPDRFGQGYSHARGYRRSRGADLMACADLDADRANRFAREFGLEQASVFEDHDQLLRDASPDVVSVCTPPASHPQIVQDCVDAGVDAIHCEKPLATTWGGCLDTARACAAAGVTLTVNHQRRFARPFRRAKTLLGDGAIGDLETVAFRARNLFDYGVHMFDLCGYLTNEATVEWVLAVLEYETEDRWYGIHNENRAWAQWHYETGVEGFGVSGLPAAMDARMRLVGTDGRIEIEPDDGPILRVGTPGNWRRVRTRGEMVDKIDPRSPWGIARRVARNLPFDWARRITPAGYTERGVVDLVAALREGREPELVVENSLAATELVFACYESVRRDERVTLPLDIRDNPLASMVAEGRLDPDSPK